MTSEPICQVPNCHKVAIYPTHGDKLACITHWEEFEQWKADRGI